MDMVSKLQYFIPEKWARIDVSVLVGGSSDTAGPQHLVQSLGCSRCNNVVLKWMESVSCLQVTSWIPVPPTGTGHCCLTCLPGTKAPSLLACQLRFLGDCELPAGSTLISVPAGQTARDHTQSIVVGW